jgi:hypothetical protein
MLTVKHGENVCLKHCFPWKGIGPPGGSMAFYLSAMDDTIL